MCVLHPFMQVGASIACRVLQVDTKDRRILMTCKPSMVKDKGLHICSYADARKGSVAIGFATKVSHGGVIVTFYDNVHGLVPARALIKHGVEDPVSAFTLGQVSIYLRIFQSFIGYRKVGRLLLCLFSALDLRAHSLRDEVVAYSKSSCS
jgi:hypothetical protein